MCSTHNLDSCLLCPLNFFLRERWNIVAIKELRDQSKYCFQKADKNVITKRRKYHNRKTDIAYCFFEMDKNSLKIK